MDRFLSFLSTLARTIGLCVIQPPILMCQVTFLSQGNYSGGPSALTYGQSDKLSQIQTPVDELTTSGKQIKSISAGCGCVTEGRR